MRAKILFSILLAAVCSSAIAGLFGPDNYEECVLDKMKGQSPALLHIASEGCRKQFPRTDKEIWDEARKNGNVTLEDIRRMYPETKGMTDYEIIKQTADQLHIPMETVADQLGVRLPKP